MKPKPLPPYDLVSTYINYDPQTGQGIWKLSPANNVKIGSPVGTFRKDYLVVRFKGKTYPAHRLFWLLNTKTDPLILIDHIDGNKTNNVFANLRLATYSQNGMNRSATKTNKLNIKGVCWDSKANKYKSSIRVNGKAKHIGYFADLESAIAARKLHEQQLFQEFAFVKS
jgi:hypothetical protein